MSRLAACTDDRKALRLAAELGVAVLTTPDIMKRWVDRMNPTEAETRAALQDVYVIMHVFYRRAVLGFIVGG